MKTLVYQSYRTFRVPAWIEACLESARDWARRQGYSYEFFDDTFFDCVPDDIREIGAAHRCLLADYARLATARQLLEDGWDRVIWLDADALIFAPERFHVSLESGYAFCREVWLDRFTLGKPQFKLTVNNAISVFCRDETILDFYLDAAAKLLRRRPSLQPTTVGTDFLVRLHRAFPFPLVQSLGIFGPEMAARYVQNDGEVLRPYLNFQRSPVYGANLCLSHQGAGNRVPGAPRRAEWTDAQMLALVRRLQADRGASLNAWYSGDYQAHDDEFNRPLTKLVAVRVALNSLRKAMKQN